MVPVIELWIEQKYLNVPVALNVKLKAANLRPITVTNGPPSNNEP